MSSKALLRVEPCSRDAAKYAVEHWHYSEKIPAGKLVSFGAWESGQFIGCVIFGRGANRNIGHPFGLLQTEVCELVRVALGNHESAVSRIIAICLRTLKRTNPGIRLTVSYADTLHGHYGGIYQAGNWIFIGIGSLDPRLRLYKHRSGKTYHWRSVSPLFQRAGISSCVENARRLGFEPLQQAPKYKYLYPLDAAMREQIAPLSKPYPKRAASIDSDAPGDQSGEGGVIPTAALQGATNG